VDEVTAVTVDVEEPTVTVEPTDTPEVEKTVSVVEVLAAVAVVAVEWGHSVQAALDRRAPLAVVQSSD
jgi:hypothetical protein